MDPRRSRSPPTPRARPGRIWVVILVTLTVSLALDLGSAASLLSLSVPLPVAGCLALLAALTLVPGLVLFLGPRGEVRSGALALWDVSIAASLGSYFVGGSVGPASDATVFAALILLVPLFAAGHPWPEEPSARRHRWRRWGVRGMVSAAVALIVGLALIAIYATTPPVSTLGRGYLGSGGLLQPGERVSVNLTAGMGDTLFALVASPLFPNPLLAQLFGTSGGPLENTSVGSPREPSTLTFHVTARAGRYQLSILDPATGPRNATVNWTFLRIPAALVALGSAGTVFALSGLFTGVVALVTWVRFRPPPPPPREGTLAYQRWLRVYGPRDPDPSRIASEGSPGPPRAADRGAKGHRIPG
jgi:hypothetical protein